MNRMLAMNPKQYNKKLRCYLAGVLLAVAFAYQSISPTLAAQRCEQWAGKALSIQGKVEVSHAGQIRWDPIANQDLLCPGDRLRVNMRSRAAILLPNKTLLRLAEGSVLTFMEADTEDRSWLDLLRGVVHFISRTPRSLNIKTPFVSAGVEGTEFVIKVEATQTRIWVFEGKVSATNKKGSLLLASGEAAVAKKGSAPARKLVVRPRNAVQWALYYPPVIDSRENIYTRNPDSPALGEALALYRKGDLSAAFARLDALPTSSRSAQYHNLHAGLLLNVGLVDEARAEISQALALDPNNGTAYALQSVIAVAQNDNESALVLAQKGEELSPQSPVPKIALSYAYQALFDIEQAKQSVEQAVKVAPRDALVWARLAELELSLGDLDSATAAAHIAVEHNPNLARTQTVLGFANLVKLKIDQAIKTFDSAIGFNPADPLPRLGLGLAKIREGDLDEGTEQIEIAAILDPDNALVRSYLGKAYYEQKRNGLARTEFAIAKELDPKDPTPWFYHAILKQTENRPVEALHDLQRAMTLNDNRAVYRSRFLLDVDQAARGTSLSRIFDDLDFKPLALVTSSQSLSLDPANASAHRFLSSAYTNLPRYGIAQVSELLQSQLLQPLNVDPVEPRLSLKGVSISPGAKPTEAIFNEHAQLFVQQRPWLTIAGGLGNNDTLWDEAVIWGQKGQGSYSLGQFHYETDGFRENANIEHDIYNAFTQVAVTEKLNLQLEYRYRETSQGDIRLELDPAFQPVGQRELRQQVGRAGLRFSPSPHSDILTSLIYSDRDEEFTRDIAPIHVLETDGRHGYEAEAQYLLRKQRFNLTMGFGAYSADAQREVFTTTESLPPPPLVIPGLPELSDLGPSTTQDRVNFDIDGENIYAYANITYPPRLAWTLGLSYETYERSKPDFNLTKTNPKLGLQWDITGGLTLRAAFIRTLKRLLVVDQTLEPTQVAGFNQFFDDLNGTQVSLYGVGLDAVFKSGLYGGLEYSRRELTVPAEITTENRTKEIVLDTRDEDQIRAYLYWTPHRDWALNGEYRFERDELAAFELRAHMVPLKATYFSPNGLFTRLGVVSVWQEENRESQHLSDRFTVADIAIGYRLAKRQGVVSLGINNLFDKQFHYKDVSWKQSDQFNIIHLFEPDRTIMTRLVLNF